MTEAEHQANDDYVAKLEAIRAELVALGHRPPRV